MWIEYRPLTFFKMKNNWSCLKTCYLLFYEYHCLRVVNTGDNSTVCFYNEGQGEQFHFWFWLVWKQSYIHQTMTESYIRSETIKLSQIIPLKVDCNLYVYSLTIINSWWKLWLSFLILNIMAGIRYNLYILKCVQKKKWTSITLYRRYKFN